MRRAKIVCTMGPAVESPEKVKELIDAGMNMARLNLSHGSYEEHQARLDSVRDAAKAAGRPVAILVDLQGPKIRLARFKAGPHDLARGDIFTITVDDVEGTKERVGTTYKGLPGDCKAGDRILIDDGKVTVEVVEVKGNDVITKVIEPGAVSNNKGINLPGVAVSVPALSEKDIEDLRWGLRAGADFIALSFVRSAEDIKDVHKIMDEEGIRVPVIAKIEKPQAVENLVEIVDAFDALHDIADGGLQFARLNPDSQASAFFIGLKDRGSVFSVRRQIDSLPNSLMAVMPGVALDELWSSMEIAENALLLIALGVLITTILGITATLLVSLESRRRELAIFRAVGAKPYQVLSLILTEALMVCVVGILLGWSLLQLIILTASDYLRKEWGVVSEPSLPSMNDGLALLYLALVVLISASIPAIKAYRMVLSEGLNPPS